MSELEKWLEEYHDRERRERVAKHDMKLRAEAAAQEREIAIEHERAVLEVRDEYGGRIRTLEAENKSLADRVQDLESQLSDPANGEWRAEYPLLSLITGMINNGQSKKAIARKLKELGYSNAGIGMMLRSRLEAVDTKSLARYGERLLNIKE